MNVLIVADLLSGLKPDSDTGLALAREAIERKHSVYWCTPDNIIIEAKGIRIDGTKITECPEDSLPTIVERDQRLTANEIDTIWIRKDPPFDTAYLSMCWKLRLIKDSVDILNPIDTLLGHHEKLIPIFAANSGVFPEEFVLDSYIGKCKELAKYPEIQKHLKKPYIVKPWLGHGGAGVQTMSKDFQDFCSEKDPSNIIAQNFIDNVSEVGDRRVIFIDGDYVGDFVRIPAKNSFIANLAQGGTAEIRKPSTELENLFSDLGKYLKSQNIFLAGADFIGNYLTEVNITAPTGFQNIRKLTGKNIAEIFVKKSESRLEKI